MDRFATTGFKPQAHDIGPMGHHARKTVARSQSQTAQHSRRLLQAARISTAPQRWGTDALVILVFSLLLVVISLMRPPREIILELIKVSYIYSLVSIFRDNSKIF